MGLTYKTIFTYFVNIFYDMNIIVWVNFFNNPHLLKVEYKQKVTTKFRKAGSENKVINGGCNPIRNNIKLKSRWKDCFFRGNFKHMWFLYKKFFFNFNAI